MSTRPLLKQEITEIETTLGRLRDQARNAALLSTFMVHDESIKSFDPVVPDFSIGDFLVFDRKLHPEYDK